MREFKSIFSVVLVSCSLWITAQAAPSNEKSVRIVGGDFVADQKDAPFIVSLENFCGGTIIDEKWILTAAHCITQPTREIVGGSLNRMNEPEEYSVIKTIVHPKYERIIEGLASRYDYALLKLEKGIDFNTSRLKKIRIADPAFAERDQRPGALATVFGWGAVSEKDHGGLTVDLHFVQIPLVSMETANLPEVYNHYLDHEDTMLPAGDLAGGKDACNGDSGGPLVLKDSVTGENVLAGVVSWGAGCARVNKVGLYAKVSFAYDWIMKTMKEN